jgi:predicted thioesterase
VILRAAGATVEVQARIRSIDRDRGLITVATDSGAVLTGTPTHSGAIEVTVS